MRYDLDALDEDKPALLYMARRLSDALRLEKLLDANKVNYAVETGSYVGGLLFRRELIGAYFYVATEQLDSARVLLVQNRYKPYTES